MKSRLFGLSALLLTFAAAVQLHGAKVTTYDLPDIYSLSEQATMTVNGKNVDIVRFAEYDHAHFSFSGRARIEITTQEEIKNATVSPLAKSIRSETAGNVLSFTIRESVYMIVKIDGLREIVIAADPLETDLPDASVKPVLDITQSPYHADATGKTLSTEAIGRALQDAAGMVNGATVYVPAGLFVFDSSLVLNSNVDLYLAGGAVLRSSETPDRYTRFTNKESLDNMPVTWLLYTPSKTENVKVYGRGTIDANGDAMRNRHKWLANIFTVRHCKNIKIDGVTFKDGGFWSLQTVRAENVEITNTKHLNRMDVWRVRENDAIDICESSNVKVRHTIAISEDDTYSTKSYEKLIPFDEENGYVTMPVANVTFEDCLGWSNCATFKVGDGCITDHTDITFRNSYHYSGMQAIKINHIYGYGKYKNIVYENIDIERLNGRSGDGNREWLTIFVGNRRGTGPIEDVHIRNINIRAPKQTPSIISGLSETGYIKNVTIEKVRMPGLKGYGTTLEELNIKPLNPFVSNVVILPSK